MTALHKATDLGLPPAFTGTVPGDIAAGLSGLEFLRRIGEGEFPIAPMAGVIPVRPIEVEHGRIVFEGLPEKRFYNTIGSVHGGYAATLLDTAMGCAVHSTLPAGRGYTTAEIKISYLRAVTAKTGPVFAEGKIIHSGGRLATAEGFLRDGEGQLLAHGTTTCLVFALGR